MGRTRSQASREAILTAAAEILQEEGYSAVKIERIASRAGTGKGTIYRWWPNKGAIFMELYERESALVYHPSEEGTVQDQLEEFTRAGWRLWRDTASGGAFRSILAEAQGDPASLQKLRDEFMPRRRNLAETIFERARARGEINPEVNIQVAVDLIIGFNWYHLLTNQLEDESVIPPMIRLLLEGACRMT